MRLYISGWERNCNFDFREVSCYEAIKRDNRHKFIRQRLEAKTEQENSREKKILYGAQNRESGESLFFSEQFARTNDWGNGTISFNLIR